ncbi:membrane protein insertase YidC [Neotabrizicola sp. VNH66]|uniref:membrane protein insertase YidC n=1 Tax=Neotabrizicola sp. VNH66 TaxID=3400918 RepID=UPI003C0B89A9
MDDNNNKNLILATVLSFLVILVWFVLFPPPEPAPAPDTSELTLPAQPAAPATAEGSTGTVADAEPAAARLTVDTPSLEGSVSLRGGRIDDISLKTYRETLDPNSPIVRLLSPAGEPEAFYALFGWSPTGSLTAADVPGPRTEWTQVEGGTLAPGAPVALQWDNGKGLVFTRRIAVDEKFMFTVTDSVVNTSGGDVALAPYAQIARHGIPSDLQKIFVVHEGVISQADGTRQEHDYSDVKDLTVVEREQNPAEVIEAKTDGWIGFTDHYWMAVLVPEQGKPFTQVTKYVASADIFQTEVRQPLMTVAAGQTATTETRFFAGAKEWATIRDYENDPGFISGLFGTKANPDEAPIPGFINSIDWGWFYFLTKPIFAMLHWIHGAIGNMGLAIIALTFVLKIIVLPLAYKSYVSMARMKELQPEMEAIKERAAGDSQKLQKEMMQLYRDRKVNPAAGCLPILIQIPIFFSLYKVIFVTIELRHAPFFGWLKDLSAPDPSSLYNLFGLLPWDAPMPGTVLHLIFIGILPIILGITMWLQQKLNPAPADPVQASIFAWMPWVFMFMLGGFASGLVVYWITNNLITFSQQYIIMRSHGHKPDLFGNIRKGFRKKEAAAAANVNKPPAGKKK